MMMMAMKQRDLDVVLMRDELRETFENIGKACGVTRSRARAIYVEAKRKIAASERWDSWMSSRLRNVCANAGIENVDQLQSCLQDGTLRRQRNCGRKLYDEAYSKLLEVGRVPVGVIRTQDKAIEALREIEREQDTEARHQNIDALMCELIENRGYKRFAGMLREALSKCHYA